MWKPKRLLDRALDASIFFSFDRTGFERHARRFEDPDQTKRAEVILGELWAERLRDTGVEVFSMHPGWADTPAVRESLPRFYRLTRDRLRSPRQGADTTVWLAACEDPGAASGTFFFDRRPAPTHVFPWTRESEPDRRELWRLCEEQCSDPSDETGAR